MGQLTSTPAVPEPPLWLAPVDNVDQFIGRFRFVLEIHCLSCEERQRSRLLFEKFSGSSNPPQTWDEADMVELLSVALPDELKGTLLAAGPLLFRIMIRLGSFPYHSQPVSSLTLDMVLVAVIILLRYHERNGTAVAGTSPGDFSSEEKGMKWLRRILFQCMAIRDGSSEGCDLGGTDRIIRKSESDDEDLLGAYRYVVSTNRWRDWERTPKVLHRGPPIIPEVELPSSRSRDLSGSIPRAEFDFLVKLLLAGQLYLSGDSTEPLTNTKELDACVASVLSAFPEAREVPYITWDSYDGILSSQLPNIYIGFAGLLAPLILHGRISTEQLSSSSRTETSLLLRRAFSKVTPQNSSIPVGSIFKPRIFAQLATFLPLELCTQRPSVIYTAGGGSFRLDALKNQMRPRRQPLVILVSGTALDIASSDGVVHICFGAFLSEDDEDADSQEYLEQIPADVFQLRPTHSVSHSPTADITFQSGGNVVCITFADTGRADARFILDDGAQTASYYPRGESGREEPSPIHIKVENMDLVALGFISDAETT
ncbi:hypothetical protein F4781DRAFT_184142 [Annulohypoxylon bovei var. microspora]|nr:hypothetical protein F4781DRAFT_184142 [Annulohypoxylon bovei var. microspora]